MMVPQESSAEIPGAAVKTRDPGSSLSRLKVYLRNLEEENAHLKDRNDLLGKLAASKDAELGQFKKANADLQQNLNQLLENHALLKGELQQNAVKLKAELEDKHSELSNPNVIKFMLSTMQTQVNEMSMVVAEAARKNAEIENELVKAGQEKKDLAKKLSESDYEARKQSELNGALNTAINGLKEEMARKDAELETLKLPRHELELEIVKLKGVKEEYEARVNDLSKQRDDEGDAKDTTHKSIFELSALVTKKELEKQFELREKDKSIARLQEEYNKLLKENESLKAAINTKKRVKR